MNSKDLICVGSVTGGVYANMHESSCRVYDEAGISPTIHTCGGGNLEPKVLIRGPRICSMRGRNPENPKSRKSGEPTEQMIELGPVGIANTLTTVQKDNLVVVKGPRVRKLIPRECWRLMDFDDSDFDKAKAAGISETQLYKQAGNSIGVGVLEAILGMLLPHKTS